MENTSVKCKCGAWISPWEAEHRGMCEDCYAKKWREKNTRPIQLQHAKNLLKIYKKMREEETDERIKNSYNYAINHYKKIVKELRR